MLELDQTSGAGLVVSEWPVLICMFGSFRLQRTGTPLVVPAGGKVESLLTILALRRSHYVARDTLLALLWPNHEPNLAGQSLNSLIYMLRKQLSRALNNAPPVVVTERYYRLNEEAGVSTDLACFEELLDQGDQQSRHPAAPQAAGTYSRAIEIYQGDLWSGSDVYAVVERERLRARYLTALAWLADYHLTQGAWHLGLGYAQQLLVRDPCREDAHRLLMRCYVQLGERAQALRQYQLCRDILRVEFDAAPEPATQALYEQVRCAPGTL